MEFETVTGNPIEPFSLDPLYYAVQFTLMILSIVLLYTNVLWMARNKERLLNGVAVFFVALHTIVFYAVLLLYRFGFVSVYDHEVFFNNWSSILRIHTVSALIVMEVLRLQYTKLKQKSKEHGE